MIDMLFDNTNLKNDFMIVSLYDQDVLILYYALPQNLSIINLVNAKLNSNIKKFIEKLILNTH